MPDIPAGDNIHLTMQECKCKGTSSDFMILDCLPPLRQVPHLQITRSVVTDTPPLVPEDFDPEEGEWQEDDDDMGGPMVSLMPPQ